MGDHPFGTVDVYIEHLMQRYQQVVYTYVRTLTNDAYEADDVVQATFEQAYLYLTAHPDARLENPSAWLRVAARNTFYNLHRRPTSKEHSLEALQEQDTDPLQALISLDALPDVIAGSNEGVSEIRRHIDALPDANVREATTLFFVKELSYAEISASLGRPLGTVKNQIYRGRKSLQEGLRSWIIEGGT
jgi:RNA polymerase sigma-70 factor (ECF subfamily)